MKLQTPKIIRSHPASDKYLLSAWGDVDLEKRNNPRKWKMSMFYMQDKTKKWKNPQHFDAENQDLKPQELDVESSTISGVLTSKFQTNSSEHHSVQQIKHELNGKHDERNSSCCLASWVRNFRQSYQNEACKIDKVCILFQKTKCLDMGDK